jgi:Tfp pilus assembly protein PilO
MQLFAKKKTTPKPVDEMLKKDQPSLALQIANRYIRWILFLVVGVMLFLGYVLVLDSLVTEVRTAAQESLPTKLRTRDDLKSIKAELDRAMLDFESIKASKREALERIAQLLPSESKYGDLFTMVDTVTRLSGLRMTNISITLDESRPQQRTRQAQQPSSDDPVSTGLVRSISLRISVEGGTYEAFKRYLENLERNVRLFDVKSISFSGDAFIPNGDGTLPTPRYDIEIVTYYQP